MEQRKTPETDLIKHYPNKFVNGSKTISGGTLVSWAIVSVDLAIYRQTQIRANIAYENSHKWIIYTLFKNKHKANKRQP